MPEPHTSPPILEDFPDSFETERLLIRSPLPGDGPELFAAVKESLDELRNSEVDQEGNLKNTLVFALVPGDGKTDFEGKL